MEEEDERKEKKRKEKKRKEKKRRKKTGEIQMEEEDEMRQVKEEEERETWSVQTTRVIQKSKQMKRSGAIDYHIQRFFNFVFFSSVYSSEFF